MARPLTHDVGELLARQIADGNYRSFDDALEALRGAITDPRILEQVRAAWLQNEVAKGDAGGGKIPAEEIFAAARARIDRTRRT